MSQTLSSVTLSQQISANLASTGLQKSIPVGGINNYTISSTVADIVHSFSIIFSASNDTANWNVDTGIISPSTNVIISGGSQKANGSSLDAAGVTVPAISKIVAVYYEIPAQASHVTATATDADVGTVKLSGDGSNVKSALIVPLNKTASGIDVAFTCGAAGTIRVVYFAKKT